MSTVKSDFKNVLDRADPHAWAEQFVLVNYLRPDFRHTIPDIELMFTLAFDAARKKAKEIS